MKYFWYIFTIILLTLSVFSTSLESIGKKDQISKNSNNVIKKNYKSDSIYYFRTTNLAVINWALFTDDPGLESKKSMKIPFSEIYIGKSEPMNQVTWLFLGGQKICQTLRMII